MNERTSGLVGLLIADDERCRALAAELFPDMPPTALPAADFVPPAPFAGPLFALLERWACDAAVPAADAAEPHPAPSPAIGLVVPAVWYPEMVAGPQPLVAADEETQWVFRPGWAPAPPERGGGSGDLRAASGLPGATEGPVREPEAVGLSPAGEAMPGAIVVTDHVNLVGSGPLTGRWPAGRARSFPSLTGIYQPAQLRGQYQPAPVRPVADRPIYSLAVAGVANEERLSPFERRQMLRCGLAVASSRLVPPVVIAAYYGLLVAAVAAPHLPISST